MDYQQQLVIFKQNRVWRTYTGGKVLDEMNGEAQPKDSHFPEDWIGSTTQAKNIGREEVCEGLSDAFINGKKTKFDQLIKQDPEYFLGKKHVAAFDNNPMLLVKYLDSSVRLHFQAHPTAEFAQKHLNSRCGKAEAYYVLESRDSIEQPYIYLGFQQSPSRHDFKDMIENQHIDKMEACFEKINISPGDCFYIPGGMPHAIGEGVLIIEIMEPSDLAVRFEFEKSGYVMPVDARFMKKDLDFCLDVFDYNQYSVEDIINQYRQTANLVCKYNESSYKESLIDSATTLSFRVAKSSITGKVDKSEEDFYIGIVTKGDCVITCNGETYHLKQYERFFCPAGLNLLTIESTTGVEILECYPPIAGTL
ncbi:class I mannose-6-phosphate isomerase [Psychromonas aquatilis]|uniref:Class I mannose-6-phosphate isomerase n=1 Tax=Psychromonas aquatilis TaxID=2005072 RepID=A0ABU9GNC3_9GAMM